MSDYNYGRPPPPPSSIPWGLIVGLSILLVCFAMSVAGIMNIGKITNAIKSMGGSVGSAAGDAAETGIDHAFGGTMDKDWCKDQKCFKTCTNWNDIDDRGDATCFYDYGDGYKYSGKKGQADCTGGFGKGVCVYDPDKVGIKYTNNCVAWLSLEPNCDKWCSNDNGAGFNKIGLTQGNCTKGFGKCICKKVDKGTRKFTKNCITWDFIRGYKDCNDDFGGGWNEESRGQWDCPWSKGKVFCRFDG